MTEHVSNKSNETMLLTGWQALRCRPCDDMIRHIKKAFRTAKMQKIKTEKTGETSA
jgi:hypothetical protein